MYVGREEGPHHGIQHEGKCCLLSGRSSHQQRLRLRRRVALAACLPLLHAWRAARQGPTIACTAWSGLPWSCLPWSCLCRRCLLSLLLPAGSEQVVVPQECQTAARLHAHWPRVTTELAVGQRVLGHETSRVW